MRRAHGFTLVELIMGIVVMAVAVGGVLLAMRTTVAKSADPMIAHQGIAIAEAYMEEILTKNFQGCASAIRATFNSVDCYAALPAPHAPESSAGSPIPELAAYEVIVSVGGTCNLGLVGGEKRISVLVTHASNDFAYQLDGCITDY